MAGTSPAMTQPLLRTTAGAERYLIPVCGSGDAALGLVLLCPVVPALRRASAPLSPDWVVSRTAPLPAVPGMVEEPTPLSSEEVAFEVLGFTGSGGSDGVFVCASALVEINAAVNATRAKRVMRGLLGWSLWRSLLIVLARQRMTPH